MTTQRAGEPRAWGVVRRLDEWRMGSARILKETPKRLILEDAREGGLSALGFTGYRSHVAPEDIARSQQEAVEQALVKEREALAKLEAEVDERHQRIRELEALGARVALGAVEDAT